MSKIVNDYIGKKGRLTGNDNKVRKINRIRIALFVYCQQINYQDCSLTYDDMLDNAEDLAEILTEYILLQGKSRRIEMFTDVEFIDKYIESGEKKSRLKWFSDNEVYMLSRQAIESSAEIVPFDRYSEAEKKLRNNLLNELSEERKVREK